MGWGVRDKILITTFTKEQVGLNNMGWGSREFMEHELKKYDDFDPKWYITREDDKHIEFVLFEEKPTAGYVKGMRDQGYNFLKKRGGV